jgi:4-hydroxy-tetrahydrodipicolinate synthase
MTEPELVVAPLTPFNNDLKIDFSILKREINYVIDDCGATMVVAAGVLAQEYTYLSFSERKELIRKTFEFVGGRRPVIVGVSHPSFRISIELAHFANDLGAHAIQLLAPLRPFGGLSNERDLMAYFEAVTKETPLPIALYLNAGPGADVPISTTIAISQIDRIHYIKESSRDLSRVSRLIVEIDHAKHARYFTTIQMLLATLELGGSGAEMPPPAAEIARKVIDAYVAGDYLRAAKIQLQFALFPSKWMHRGLTATMKAAMRLIGMPLGDLYPPYASLDASENIALEKYLKTTVLAKRLK